MTAALIGHRSWLAQPIVDELRKSNIECATVHKATASLCDLSKYDTAFLIAGRARPTVTERLDEVNLVCDIMNMEKPPGRLVYISSLAAIRENNAYAHMKRTCEGVVLSRDFGVVVRPPVIYGPGQNPDAKMLLPSIARSLATNCRSALSIDQPTKKFHLMHVEDVVHHAVAFGTGQLYLPLGERILNLKSNLMSPIDIIGKAAPGMPFQINVGWSADKNYPAILYPPEQINLEYDLMQSVYGLHETVEHLVKVIHGREQI